MGFGDGTAAPWQLKPAWPSAWALDGGLILSRLENYLPLDLDGARCLLENIET